MIGLQSECFYSLCVSMLGCVYVRMCVCVSVCLCVQCVCIYGKMCVGCGCVCVWGGVGVRECVCSNTFESNKNIACSLLHIIMWPFESGNASKQHVDLNKIFKPGIESYRIFT